MRREKHRNAEAEELRLALIVLRALRGWTQAELAAEAGTTASVLSEYESGKRLPTRKAVERMAVAVGVPPAFLEALLPALRSLIAAHQVPPTAAVNALHGQTLAENLLGGLEPLLGEAGKLIMFPGPSRQPSPPAPEDRKTAQTLWLRLARYGPADRRTLVEEGKEFQSWALSERLCAESLAAASPDEAVELAELALRAAELMAGEDSWRSRLQAYAWAHLANARRARGELAGAREAYGRYAQLWQQGSAADPELLAEPDCARPERFK